MNVKFKYLKFNSSTDKWLCCINNTINKYQSENKSIIYSERMSNEHGKPVTFMK